jgi:hypothetical protein
MKALPAKPERLMTRTLILDARGIRMRQLAASLLLAAGLASMPGRCPAQITSGSGSQQQDNRISDMSSQQATSDGPVHESHAPQSKDAAGKPPGKTQGSGQHSDGAGGFNNGLYGTGAGGNK